ncbi:hypothetical protein L3Q82_023739 [Scortum barcoo]|uniref:Uncharacterized protein n=1 Tax=Scortum barcoo TaxID=214431 RepID=A0ACB8WUW6_9TELE|nr:hypothetical protein L3Q82_023739 [Scortum barcoo]
MQRLTFTKQLFTDKLCRTLFLQPGPRLLRSRSSSFPADSPTESRMEFVGQARPSGACGLLGVPGLSTLDVDDDEGEVVIRHQAQIFSSPTAEELRHR